MSANFTQNLLSILMPVYNERAFLRRSVERVMAVQLPRDLRRELVMVNDASTDGTEILMSELAAQYPATIRVFHQAKNHGKGAAIQRAISEMRGEYAIIQDADLEYDPQEYPTVLRPLLEGYADVVYGSRFAMREMRRVMFYHHKLGNLFLTHLSNFFTGLDLTDMETCYKAFRADLLKTIPLRSQRFGIEPELTAKIAKRGCTVYEVPVSYHGRGYADGKKIGWKDGLQAIYTIFKYWLIDDCFSERLGRRHLKSHSLGRRCTQNLAQRLLPFIDGAILEIDGGIGNLSRRLPKHNTMTITENDGECYELLREIFADNELIKVVRADVLNNPPENLTAPTVIATNLFAGNLLDGEILRNLQKTLTPNSRLLLEIPLYDNHTATTYSLATVLDELQRVGYRIEQTINFNFSAWAINFINTKILRRQSRGKWSFKIAELLQIIFNPLEKILPLPGYSVIVVARCL